MLIIKRLILLLNIIVLCNSIAAQEKESLCYGKAILPDIYQSTYELFPIYNGTDEDIPFLQPFELTLEPQRIEWSEQEISDCVSEDPQDCIMLIEKTIPAVKEVYMIVLDTSLTSDYTWERLKVDQLLRKGGTEEYVPVLCNDKIDAKFVQQLTERLQDLNYYEGLQYDIISEELKQGLIQFQKENGLPVGQLDLTSLAQLGFAYSNEK